MKRVALTALLAITLLAGSALAGKNPLSFEDLFGMKRLSDLQVSPDGRWAAVVQAEFDIDANKSTTDIWLVSLTKGERRRLTTSPARDWHPRWIAGGKELVFLSTRSGDSQIWKIPLDGGEAVQVTNLYSGVDSFAWSADGSFILFAAEVWPDAPTEAENRKKDEARAADKSTGKLLDRLFYRQWNRWVNDKYSHVFRYDLASKEIRELTPGKVHCPPLDLGSTHDFSISPDGKEVTWVLNPDAQPAVSTNNDVFRLKLDGGIPENFTASNKANDFGPSYSPDGRFFSWLAMKRPGFEADKVDLWVQDRGTGERRCLTASWDLSVDDYRWAPDNRTVYLTAADRGRVSLFAVALDGEGVKKVYGKHHNGSLNVAPDGKSLVFLQQAADRPDDVWRLDLATGNIDRLTDVNQGRMASIEMGVLEEFTFPGAKGEAVHAFFVKPPGFDPSKRYPVVVLAHGGPQGAFGDEFHYRWNVQMFASPGYIPLMINFHGSRGYGQAFMDAVSRDWGGAPYEDMEKGVDAFLARFPFADGTRLAAAGASYGGFMMNWIAGKTDRYKCLVSHDGVFDQRGMYGATEEVWFPEWEFGGKPWEAGSLYEKWSPCNLAANFRTPMLVVHSELDYRVPVSQGFQLFTTLQRLGVESKMLYFPDEDHFVSKPQNARLWWKTVLGWIGDHVAK